MRDRNNIVAILQARMGSTRLPGKVTMVICGKSLLQHVVERLQLSQEIHAIVLATTTLSEDDRIQEMAIKLGMPCYRGEDRDVLARYYGAATQAKAETIVRISGDDPLIDPLIVDRLVRKHLESNVDYTSNYTGEKDRTYPLGLRTEVFSYAALEMAHKEAKHDYEREHVTPYIYLHPEIFKMKLVEASARLRRPDLRLTVDTREDFSLVTEIYRQLYQEGKMFYTEDVIGFLDQHPELAKINASIKQKKLGE